MRWLKPTRIASLLILALVMAVTAWSHPNEPQAEGKPLSKDGILALLKAHVAAKDVAQRARERGIDFQVTPGIQDELVRSGATDELLIALREIAPLLSLSPPPTPAKSAPATIRSEASKAPDAAAPGIVKENPRDALKYVWIPPGTFQMGCSPDDDACSYDEKPSHPVRISKGFWMGQTDVTEGAYKHFVTATGGKMPRALGFGGGPRDESVPVVNVRWDDAQAYCTWAGGRLPTEAEWEYAARAGSTANRYGPIDEIAWYSYDSGKEPRGVAQKSGNAFGLFDMLGNVSQWVNDWYDVKYYQSSPAVDPPGPSGGSQRVLRGASWNHDLREVRASRRFGSAANQGLPTAGFRCVAEQMGGPSAEIEQPTKPSARPMVSRQPGGDIENPVQESRTPQVD